MIEVSYRILHFYCFYKIIFSFWVDENKNYNIITEISSKKSKNKYKIKILKRIFLERIGFPYIISSHKLFFDDFNDCGKFTITLEEFKCWLKHGSCC